MSPSQTVRVLPIVLPPQKRRRDGPFVRPIMAQPDRRDKNPSRGLRRLARTRSLLYNAWTGGDDHARTRPFHSRPDPGHSGCPRRRSGPPRPGPFGTARASLCPPFGLSDGKPVALRLQQRPRSLRDPHLRRAPAGLAGRARRGRRGRRLLRRKAGLRRGPLRKEGRRRPGQASRGARDRDRRQGPGRHQRTLPLARLARPHRAEAGPRRSRKGRPDPLAVQPLRRSRRRPRLRFPDREGAPAAGPSGGEVGRHPGPGPAPLDHHPHLHHPILALQALSERPGLRPRIRGERDPLVPGLREDEMRALRTALALIGLGLLAPFAAAAGGGGPQVVPKDELRSVAPNVFLDCDRRTCDFEYIKTEITFVNYVLDRQTADVHIIVTRQQTGSGGNEYTLAFMGLR